MMTQAQQQILVVEDDQALTNFLKALLETSGYRVQTEGTGLGALRAVEHGHPHLVVLDLRLPDMSGYDVCKQLRQSFHPWALPILMLTGMDRPADQLRGYAHGADAYLTKPCDPPELLHVVSLLLGEPQRQQENEGSG